MREKPENWNMYSMFIFGYPSHYNQINKNFYKICCIICAEVLFEILYAKVLSL